MPQERHHTDWLSPCMFIVHQHIITQNTKKVNLFIALCQIHIVRFSAFISDASNQEFPPGSLKFSKRKNIALPNKVALFILIFYKIYVIIDIYP